MSDDPRRIFSRSGLLKDVELNLLKICKQAFTEPEFARYSMHHPREYKDQDIKKTDIKDLPMLFAWCDSFNNDSDAIGGQLGRDLSERLVFHCEINYVLDFALDEEGEEFVKQIGWHLFEMVQENLDLNGIANFGGNVLEVQMAPDVHLVQGKLCPVSSIKILVDFYHTRRKKQVRRN